ncbi:MAG: hypothetical protein OEY01_03775 [Desulfobulbaceae bacterium]|nr:hypothetical protein [Desulfobulbaceae bacterium]
MKRTKRTQKILDSFKHPTFSESYLKGPLGIDYRTKEGKRKFRKVKRLAEKCGITIEQWCKRHAKENWPWPRYKLQDIEASIHTDQYVYLANIREQDLWTNIEPFDKAVVKVLYKKGKYKFGVRVMGYSNLGFFGRELEPADYHPNAFNPKIQIGKDFVLDFRQIHCVFVDQFETLEELRVRYTTELADLFEKGNPKGQHSWIRDNLRFWESIRLGVPSWKVPKEYPRPDCTILIDKPTEEE